MWFDNQRRRAKQGVYRPGQFGGVDAGNNREFKQITTAGATTAAVTEKIWGEYVSVV